MEHLVPGKIYSRIQIKRGCEANFLWSYPSPKVHKKVFKKEFESLVLLGVIEVVNDSEWGYPYFAQPKPKSN